MDPWNNEIVVESTVPQELGRGVARKCGENLKKYVNEGIVDDKKIGINWTRFTWIVEYSWLEFLSYRRSSIGVTVQQT